MEVEPGVYSVLAGERSYEFRLNGESADFRGLTVPVEITDLRDSSGSRKDQRSGPVRISAAMPGKVIRLLVRENDVVEAGQGIVVVEAMKMQNEMKAPRGGRIAAVKTQAGATVAAGELLALIE